MGKFCKLYDTTEHGQILVLLDTEDTKPSVQFLFKPIGLGVCKQALKFPDTDAGWDNAEAAFDKTDELVAVNLVAEVKNKLGL